MILIETSFATATEDKLILCDNLFTKAQRV